MPWDEGAFRALVRAFSPMPPIVRQGAMRKMAARVEAVARDRGREAVGLDEVYAGCVEVLGRKEPSMLDSLLRALADEGYAAPER